MKGRASLPILFLTMLAGCAPHVLHVDDQAPRPQRDPAAVRLMLDAPDDPYRTIAIIQSRTRNVFRSLESLKDEVRAEAARLGADAVILGLAAASDPGGTGTAPDGSVVYVAGSRELRVIGRAIVFDTTGAPREALHRSGTPRAWGLRRSGKERGGGVAALRRRRGTQHHRRNPHAPRMEGDT